MTYLRRAVKYFIKICLLFIIIIGALMAFGFVSKDVAVAFRSGWASIAYIAAAFVFMSAIYPMFGYGKRKIHAQGDPASYRQAILKAMEQRGYTLEKELPEGGYRFRLTSGIAKAARLWEDAVTLEPVLGGFQAEGQMRDLARVVMALDHQIHQYEH